MMTWKKASSLLDYRVLVLPQEEHKQVGVQAARNFCLMGKTIYTTFPEARPWGGDLTQASLH